MLILVCPEKDKESKKCVLTVEGIKQLNTDYGIKFYDCIISKFVPENMGLYTDFGMYKYLKELIPLLLQTYPNQNIVMFINTEFQLKVIQYMRAKKIISNDTEVKVYFPDNEEDWILTNVDSNGFLEKYPDCFYLTDKVLSGLLSFEDC